MFKPLKLSLLSDPSTMQLGINASHSSGLNTPAWFHFENILTGWTDSCLEGPGGEMEGEQPWYDGGGRLHGLSGKLGELTAEPLSF